MSRSSRDDHLGEIGQQVTVTGTVRTASRVNGFISRSSVRALIVVDIGAAMVKLVTAAAWAYRVERGDQITVTGTAKAHTEWRGLSQTVLARASRIDSTSDEPDAPAAAVRWEAVNPTEAGRVPFPGRPTHWPRRRKRRRLVRIADHRPGPREEGEAR